MKKITTNKMARVAAPANNDGIAAFQVVEFIISFFGNDVICEHDTRIMQDGRQFVIGGDGFIPNGYEVA